MDDHRAKKKLKSEDEKEDRISKLSDDVIHQIMLFLDARLTVQTSTLSKRWKHVWKTLPFLTFHGYNQHYKGKLNKFIYSKFINYVFSSRNHQCRIHKLDLCPSNGLHTSCLIRYVKYAISHDVQSLNVRSERYCSLSLFNSNSLKELKLTMVLENNDVKEPVCWSLPNLTNLYLELVNFSSFSCSFRGKFPQSCLNSLSALTTLRLVCCKLPKFFSLPSLTKLYLKYCSLPKNGWDFPALLTLELDNVDMRKNMGEYFLSLASLQNLAIYFSEWRRTLDCVISGFQLVNLIISVHGYTANDSKRIIVVSAPKLCNFTAIGSFPITFEGCEFENVEIKSLESHCYSSKKQEKQQEKQQLDLYKMMFSQLGSAKNLAIDLETLQKLSKIKIMLVRLESPFYNLKHLELPPGCKESSISSIVRQYLLGASPKATIVERLKTSVQERERDREDMDHRAKKKLQSEDEKEDRISKLSDNVIHQIMLFLDDARLAVQTSIFSKRWKHVWKTLPFLTFHGYNQHYKDELNKFIYSKFIKYVFSGRNHQCRIQKLDLCPSNGLHKSCLIRYVKYAISHDVQSLNVRSERYCSLSLFDSNSLKELELTMPLEYDDAKESVCWCLPNLTYLYLKQNDFRHKFLGKFLQSCLNFLSALTTLSLDYCTLPEFFSLTSLTTLKLKECILPKNGWDFPALMTLELDNVDMHNNMVEYFLSLASLQNLAIYFSERRRTLDCVISGFQLVNLIISARGYTANDSKRIIVVSAPKLCNFTAIGSFPITFEGCELENVEIKFLKSDYYCSKKQRDLYKMMFSQLGSAKNLAIDSATLQELSKISDMLVRLESPFYNLKFLELPRGCKESSISSIVRQYLLGASPKATIVESSVQDNAIPQIAPVISATAQNVVLEQPLGTTNSKKIRSQNAHENKDIRKPKERN